MPRNVYCEINLHITWHTLESAPLLTERVEPEAHRFLTHRAMQTESVVVHAVGGMPDHVHLAVSIPSTLLIADWIGDLKGSTSHHINQRHPGALAWQTGYGVVSFGTRDLAWVVEYIRTQREHHSRGDVFERLERIRRDAPESSA